jgi:NNP family nitrate/nitrite transporter-like MFS transporter
MSQTVVNSRQGLPFRVALPMLCFLTLAFWLGFLARILMGPLMVPITRDLAASNTEAGGFVLLVGLGATVGLLSSGFISRFLTHRLTISLALLGMGVGALLSGTADTLFAFQASLFAMGAGAGLYLPSAISVITSLTRRADWGKALSVHEAAPNVAFIVAPLFAEFMVETHDWRSAFTVLGAASLVAGALFALRGPGKGERGEAPSPSLLADIVRRPVFWIMSLLFGIAVGATLGPYTMLPLYLVEERGMSREAANMLLAVSRVSGVFMSFVGGMCADRFGPRRTIVVYLALAGLFTMLLGLTEGVWLTAAVLLQPLVSTTFFPAGFSMISRGMPFQARGVAVGFITPMGALIGSGAIPLGLGWCGDHIGFGAGFVMQGALMLVCLLAAWRLPRRDVEE